MPSHHDKDFRRFLTSDHEISWQLLNKKLFFLKFRFFSPSAVNRNYNRVCSALGRLRPETRTWWWWQRHNLKTQTRWIRHQECRPAFYCRDETCSSIKKYEAPKIEISFRVFCVRAQYPSSARPEPDSLTRAVVFRLDWSLLWTRSGPASGRIKIQVKFRNMTVQVSLKKG